MFQLNSNSNKKGIKKLTFKWQLKSNLLCIIYVNNESYGVRRKPSESVPPFCMSLRLLKNDAVPLDNLRQALRHKPPDVSKTFFTIILLKS